MVQDEILMGLKNFKKKFKVTKKDISESLMTKSPESCNRTSGEKDFQIIMANSIFWTILYKHYGWFWYEKICVSFKNFINRKRRYGGINFE